MITPNSASGKQPTSEDSKGSELEEEVRRLEKEEREERVASLSPCPEDSMDEEDGRWLIEKKKTIRKKQGEKRPFLPLASTGIFCLLFFQKSSLLVLSSHLGMIRVFEMRHSNLGTGTVDAAVGVKVTST
ncbi:hypothetical protein GDO78_016177 [Eleutherodactylus coqui]|uniref:Uncharacterized protein n=1 Tax=Eleutherodactylus coqui TaxID=57060 RepID=A0A8J6EAL2_ELECQ|nr:hypothetical protein GDO78_016177 [Eleutherodactylus coqui]